MSIVGDVAVGIILTAHGLCDCLPVVQGSLMAAELGEGFPLLLILTISFSIIGEAAVKLTPDEYVCVAVSVQTKYNKNPDGRSQRYETLIGSEIGKIG